MDAKIALIIGEEEVGRDEVGVKHLGAGEQVSIATGKLNEYLHQVFPKE
jgi:histidyl-tRNA synthetase